MFDDHGEPLVASHACKGKVRYRYYVSRDLQHDGARNSGCRIPALELEKAVCEAIASEIRQPLELVVSTGLNLPPDDVPRLACAAQQFSERVAKRERAAVREVIHEVRVEADAIIVQLNTSSFFAALELDVPADDLPVLSVTIPARLKRSGRAMRLLEANGRAGSHQPSRKSTWSD